MVLALAVAEYVVVEVFYKRNDSLDVARVDNVAEVEKGVDYY